MILWSAAGILMVPAAVSGIRAVRASAASVVLPFLTIAAVIVGAAFLERFALLERLARVLVPEAVSPRTAFWRVLVATALLSGLVNLDVAVVVAMPVALRIGRRTGLSLDSLAVSVAITANAASILFPTSNLTNLLVTSRDPIGTWAYVRGSWIAWLGVVVVAVVALTSMFGRPARQEGLEASRRSDPASPQGSLLLCAVDLLPMFLAVACARTLLGRGVSLSGDFAEQAALGSIFAAAVNNLPAAAAVHAASVPGAWAAILAMALGPNLLITGSVATVICRRMARSEGGNLGALGFSLTGMAITPALLLTAYAGMHVAGVT